ncbi:hypothetical protein QTJ16_006953 [Diplocarpon rosae]|uniref:Beta-lactamase-related domain-containing protein n=1 Tax=Diplocarpon rosae TaxID=946125 RepID=A0AAD9SUM7_9HELO|nr:hypothetical protein QTJ16_006953 [Diplocarpon rosae]
MNKMVGSFEQKMQDAVDCGLIPGAVLVAGDREDKFRYEKTFGHRSLKSHDPMQLDATMWLASCTKLVTTVAAMQCVERGQLSLDDDVSIILPELKDIQILTGFEEVDGKEKPILVKNTKTITLRHLLTHSSGLSYDFFNPVVMKYRKIQGKSPNLTVKVDMTEAFTFPLLFAPGDSWEYGVGIDWAGWMVERVNGNISLDKYIEENIWAPLGVNSFTFFPKQKSGVLGNLTDMSKREGGLTRFGTTANPDGQIVHSDDMVWNMDARGCAGGAGGYGAPLDYQKMLHSLLVDDEKLLKKATVDEMFKPQLSDAAREMLCELIKTPEVNQTFGGHPPGTRVDYGLGGLIILDDVVGRRKGTMTWGGYPNLIWFIDRAGGMSGIYGSQIVPPGDPKTLELFEAWSEEIYQKGGKQKL